MNSGLKKIKNKRHVYFQGNVKVYWNAHLQNEWNECKAAERELLVSKVLQEKVVKKEKYKEKQSKKEDF